MRGPDELRLLIFPQPLGGALKNQTIQPGEVQEIELSCTVTEILIGKKWFRKLEEETYTLVYWWYPVQKELVFTNE